MPESSLSLDGLQFQLGQLKSQIEQLQGQLDAQDSELADLKDRIPDSNIISPKFLNRAFTIWGHYVVAGFIIAIPFICLTSLFALVMILITQPQ
ncbi:hypothetical protein ACFLY4_09030 [Chloroflexota bacterium]|jgi:hypothetical protein